MKWKVTHARSQLNGHTVLAEGWLVLLHVGQVKHGTGAWFPHWHEAAAFAFGNDPGRFL